MVKTYSPNSRAYRKFKDDLREEFSYCCVYCGKSEAEGGGVWLFEVDHYRPKKKFPHLICTYSNLLYACKKCNVNKDNYWPSIIDKMFQKIVLNPRNDEVDRHIESISPIWRGRTRKGKWNIYYLKLCDKANIERRRDRIIIQDLIEQLTDNKKIHVEIIQNNELSDDQIESHREKILEIDNQIRALTNKIEGPKE